MYTIESAYGIARAQGAVWQTHDIASLTGVEVFSLFRRLYITLSAVALANPVSINIVDYQAVLAYDPRPMSVIFDDWTDTTTLIASVVPHYTVKHAIFTDIFRAGYDVQRSIPGAHYTSSQDDTLKTEMQITRVGTDMNLLQKFCLVSANGYFYRIEATRDVAYVAEAGKTLLKSRMNHVGLLSFEKIGRIDTYPVDTTSLLEHTIGAGLFKGINVAVPTVPLVNKTVMLVVAGHLHFQSDGVFTALSETRCVINPGNLALLERVQESKTKIDWSTILGSQPSNVVDMNVLRSDAAMTALLAHPQTFWVVVDTPNLVKTRLPVRSLPLPGQFIASKEPNELLVAGSGYVLEYWKLEQAGEWAVNCSGVRPGRAISGTIGREGDMGSVALVNVPYSVPFSIHADFLDIVADEITA